MPVEAVYVYSGPPIWYAFEMMTGPMVRASEPNELMMPIQVPCGAGPSTCREVTRATVLDCKRQISIATHMAADVRKHAINSSCGGDAD